MKPNELLNTLTERGIDENGKKIPAAGKASVENYNITMTKQGYDVYNLSGELVFHSNLLAIGFWELCDFIGVSND